MPDAPPVVVACAVALVVWSSGCTEAPDEPPPPRPTLAPPPVDLEVLDPLVAAALEDALGAVSASPDDPSAWRTLALTAHANAAFPTAGAAYEAWLGLSPDDAQGWALLARVRRELTDFDGALDALRRSLELAPDHAPSWALLGRWHLADGRLAEARDAFARATAEDAELAAGWIGLARAALQQGELDAAGTALATWLQRRPGDRYATWLLGTLRRRQGRTDEAAELLARGAGVEPEWRDPWEDALVDHVAGYNAIMDRAVALGQQGRGDEAVEPLETLADARPDDLAVLEKLVAGLLDADRPRAALSRLDAAAPTFGDHPRTAFLRGLALEDLGELTAAREAAARSVELLPWPPALALLARLHWRLGDVPGAAEHLERLIALDPADLAARMKLARALVLTERPRDAAAVLDAALLRFPDDADLHAQRAEVALALDDREAAWRFAERAAQIDVTPTVERILATLRAIDPDGAARRGDDDS